MSTASELRAKARGTLGKSIFSNGWLFAILVEIIVGAIVSALSATGVGAFILSGVFTGAAAYYFQKRVTGEIEHDSLSALIDAPKKDLGGLIVTGMLVSVFTFLWTMLFIIPGIVKSYSYAMTFYIKNDHPEYSASEAITESRRMMNGNKMRLFGLHLSFIGWWILGILCFGIGTLWVSAYVSMATAEFYEELKANDYQFTPAANAENADDGNSII